MKTLILSMLLATVSCGESPLFNHKMESNNLIKDIVRSESDSLRFKKTDYSFLISWVEGPQMGGSRFIMKTWKNDSGSMNGPFQDLNKNLHVFLWMPSMGHGSAPVKIKKLGDGEYEVSEVQFIMGGKWEIKFQLKNGAQVFDETVVSLSL
jgi:YtkA-like